MSDKRQTLEEWLNDPNERPTPEEMAQDEAEREERKGTMWEWAQMQDDGLIGVRSACTALDGSHGTGGFTVSPDDDDYEKAKLQYGLSKPGDTYYIRKKLVNDEWIVLLEERPEQEPSTDNTECESKSA